MLGAAAQGRRAPIARFPTLKAGALHWIARRHRQTFRMDEHKSFDRAVHRGSGLESRQHLFGASESLFTYFLAHVHCFA